ncbi:PREDICTED: uncharacterized protein LOC109361828 [Lupinus angustifolius]|uniref:uncharacterized protein LOC109361828 n=1 Tax=Lupinus angustifolius TaxID=3871 RepID=UPI00092E5D8A|nr:PREDICTED: uncharacterized protein LOC109361828 [Lupinus angustifolius]
MTMSILPKPMLVHTSKAKACLFTPAGHKQSRATPTRSQPEATSTSRAGPRQPGQQATTRGHKHEHEHEKSRAIKAITPRPSPGHEHKHRRIIKAPAPRPSQPNHTPFIATLNNLALFIKSSATFKMTSSSSNIPSSHMDITQDPYYVHPSDNPGTALVSPPLNGNNYHQWNRSMRMSLISKQKFEFVDGSIQMPAKEDPIFKAWERANNMDHKAYEIWEELRERFFQGNLFRIADLQETIANYRQGELSVSKYHTEMKSLWDELEIFRPLAKCNYNSEKFRTEDKVIRFLKGLNDSYSNVRSQIMLMEPLPNMNKVLSLVIQQETQMYGNDSEAKAMQVGTSWKKGGAYTRDAGQNSKGFSKNTWNKSPSSTKFCTHCKKPGHTIETRYRIHGFPPNFQFTKNQQINSMTTTHDQDKHKDEDEVFGFSKEQYRGLITMLQQQHGQNKAPSQEENLINTLSTTSTPKDQQEEHQYPEGNSISQWILDNGATDHVSYNISYYSAYYKIKPIRFKLPTGHEILDNIAGTIPISRDLERNSLKMIGIARISKGLYVLQGAKLDHHTSFSFTNSATVSKHNLWHNRLAHPSQSSNKSPYEILHKTKFQFQNLRVFGCLCYTSTLKHLRDKFNPRSSKCVFIGFQEGVKGYIVLNLKSRAIQISRDVTFHVHVFPYGSPQNDTPDQYDQLDLEDYSNLLYEDIMPQTTTPEPQLPNHPSESPTQDSSELPTLQNRKSNRTHKTPTYLQDYHCALLKHDITPFFSFHASTIIGAANSNLILGLLISMLLDNDNEHSAQANASPHQQGQGMPIHTNRPQTEQGHANQANRPQLEATSTSRAGPRQPGQQATTRGHKRA